MKRAATGIVIGILWLLLLLQGGPLLFWFIILTVAGGVLHEFTRMTLNEFPVRDRLSVLILGLLPVAAAFFGTLTAINGAMLLALVLFFLDVFFHYKRRANSHELAYRGVFAIVYIGLLFAHAHLLRLSANGSDWLLFLSIVIVASDSGAFYGGTLFGRHKLCPAISPGKTVEGLISGLLAAALAALIARRLLLPDYAAAPILVAAVGLALVGVAGDLLESSIKRAAAVKDSGRLLPGHGGLFDRLDALLLAVPVLYYILALGLLF